MPGSLKDPESINQGATWRMEENEEKMDKTKILEDQQRWQEALKEERESRWRANPWALPLCHAAAKRWKNASPRANKVFFTLRGRRYYSTLGPFGVRIHDPETKKVLTGWYTDNPKVFNGPRNLGELERAR